MLQGGNVHNMCWTFELIPTSMFFGQRFLIAKIRVNIYTLKLIFSLSSSARQNERLTERECSIQTLFGVLTKTYDVLEQGCNQEFSRGIHNYSNPSHLQPPSPKSFSGDLTKGEVTL